jgi:hypothetical protein
MGRIFKSREETRSTLLACAPGKGFETGEVRRWAKSQRGAVMVRVTFCMMRPTSPILLSSVSIHLIKAIIM